MLKINEKNIRLLPLWSIKGVDERFTVYTIVSLPLMKGKMKDFPIMTTRHIRIESLAEFKKTIEDARKEEIQLSIAFLQSCLDKALKSGFVMQGKKQEVFELNPQRYKEATFNFENDKSPTVETYAKQREEFDALSEDTKMALSSTKLGERMKKE